MGDLERKTNETVKTRRLRRADLARPTRPIVCVDLNGVLDRYTGWKDADHWDPPRDGAAAFLAALTSRGFDVVVFTTRHKTGVRQWLSTYGLLDYVAAITDRKPPAHVFVDDRAVCFTGDFDRTLESVVSFTAHWEATGASERAPQRASTARARSTNVTRRRAKR